LNNSFDIDDYPVNDQGHLLSENHYVKYVIVGLVSQTVTNSDFCDKITKLGLGPVLKSYQENWKQ